MVECCEQNLKKIDFFLTVFLQKKLIENQNFNLIEVHTKNIYV